MWLHNIADALIWLSYVAIPFVLVYFSRRRRDLPFPWMFWMFGAFIIGCGTTHLMEVITSYTPLYRLSGVVKVVTGAVSVATAVALIPLVPKALALRSPAELQKEMDERRRVEDALRQSEERFRLLVEGVHDYAIFMLDPAGRVATWNAGAERMKGYKAEEIIGQHFSCFYPQEALERGWPERELEAATNAGRVEDEGWRVRKDGSRFWANVVVTALRDPDGRLRGFTKVTRDISERKRAQEKLHAYASKLQHSNRELEQFASVASHDLQEPLRKIQAFGDRLQAKYADALDEQAGEYLRRMQQSAARMRTLINDLLTFSRLSVKARPFALVNLTHTAREVISDLEGRIQESGGQVEFDALPVVCADPTQMRQLLQNLIGNALKFHRPGEPPRVRVEGRVLAGLDRPFLGDGSSAPLCQITVRDNGIGFEQAYLDRIFQIFQRLHGRSDYEGSGMGLAICRKIVERHGGHITATSEPGHGAAFIVTLPLRQLDEDPHHEKVHQARDHLDGG